MLRILTLIALCLFASCSFAAELPNGGSISGITSSQGFEDIHTFTASVGDSVILSVAGNISLSMTLSAPNGTDLGTTNGFIYINSVTLSGNYTVGVRSKYTGQIGSYDLHFVKAPGANEHGALTNGGQYSGSLTAGDLDSFTFTASSGDSVMLSVVGNTSLSMTLYAPDGTRAGLTNSVIIINSAILSGTYTVVVRSLNAPGDYDLHFVKAPGANEHGALTNGGQYSGSLTAGDLDSFTFTASSGDSVMLSVVGNTSLSMTLYAPDGTRAGLTNSVIIINSAILSGTYTVVVRSLNAPGDYQLSYTRQSQLLSYAALGDSYSAGEGVLPFYDDYEFMEGCHRSQLAYATYIRLPGTSNPIADQSDADFDFYACTGAVTDNVTAAGEGQHDEPPQLALENEVDDRRDLVTITIGGNDAQFIRIILYCLIHNHCNDLKPFDPYLDLELGDLSSSLLVDYTRLKLLDLYAEIKRKTPNATVLVMGYPILMGGNECGAVKVPGLEESNLSAAEQMWLRDINAQLNDAIGQAAAQVGLHYVPVADHFEGHGVCGEKDDWINGLFLLPPEASFHPTARGQYEYARIINQYLESIRIGWPEGYFPNGLPHNPAPEAQTTVAGDTTLPQFGDLRVSLMSPPAGCTISQDIIVPGQSSQVQGSGFAAGEEVSLKLEIAGQSLNLGIAFADAGGMLDAIVDIPANLTTDQTGSIEALGAGNSGAGLLLMRLVRVALPITVDSDNDGIPDGCDNCPNTLNSDQVDADQDGKGDLCDACPQEFIDDQDGDGLCASVDICPLDPDNDADHDGLCANKDNCASVSNANQEDTDGDGVGDMCEALACVGLTVSSRFPTNGDLQVSPATCGADGYFQGSQVTLKALPETGQVFTGWTGDLASTENPLQITISNNMVLTANFCSSSQDSDGDMIGDECDNCPEKANSDQLNTDDDSSGNACDEDDDNDGLTDLQETGTGIYHSLSDTGTDPLVSDTDGDGIGDGAEIEQGSNPCNALSIPSAITITLKPGFNLLAIPADVVVSSNFRRDWMPVIGDASQIEKVMSYAHDTEMYVTFMPGENPTETYALTGGEGLIIYAKIEKEVTFTSRLCKPLDLQSGFNLIGIACPIENYSAFDFLNDQGRDAVSSIQRYSTGNGVFETATFGPGNNQVGIDFKIIPGEGYFVNMK